MMSHEALRKKVGVTHYASISVWRSDLAALLAERDLLLKALRDIDSVTACTDITGFESGGDDAVAVKVRVAALLNDLEGID